MSYMQEDFLLKTETAKRLYHEYAKDMPIFDYHCHLPEKQIWENKPFKDICEVWLGGDHYKWRLMRNYGVNERYITGEATNREKFTAYCKTLSTAFGNPLYHWSQAELKTFFCCEKEINEENAEAIWEECNAYIRENNLTPQKLIESSNVKYLFTTNEVFDDLSTFEKIAKKGYKFKVYPAFRADKLRKLAAMYQAFLQKGGMQLQINYLSQKELLEAQKNPEKYRSLVVRVTGYSGYFTRFDADLQNDIIRRTVEK